MRYTNLCSYLILKQWSWCTWCCPWDRISLDAIPIRVAILVFFNLVFEGMIILGGFFWCEIEQKYSSLLLWYFCFLRFWWISFGTICDCGKHIVLLYRLAANDAFFLVGIWTFSVSLTLANILQSHDVFREYLDLLNMLEEQLCSVSDLTLQNGPLSWMLNETDWKIHQMWHLALC